MAEQLQEEADALWYVGAGRVEIRSQRLEALRPGEIRVRALYGAVSRGTERLVLAGRVPESEYQRMRAPFMAGAFPFPVKYGYATVGRVEVGPEALHNRIVFALHPHQNVFHLPLEAAFPTPAAVPPARAALAANMETALNAVWDSGASAGDEIAVVGAGVVGALVAWLCARLPGARTTLIDIEPSRADLARALGVGFAAPEAAPADCDVVIHASGTSAGLATALRLAGEEASVVELSWYGAGDVAVPLGGAFHSRRLRLVSSQVGRIAPSRGARWTNRRRLAAALELLADSRLDALLTPQIGFYDLPARLPDVLAPQSGALCQLIAYPGAENTPVTLKGSPLFAVEVRDHIMIAHSFRGAIFGPAQALHGATFVIDAAFTAEALSSDGIVIDIGRAHEALKSLLAPLNYRNLDDMPEFKGRNTTTEVLTKYVFDGLAAAARAGELGRAGRELAAIRVTISESHVARAWYESPLW